MEEEASGSVPAGPAGLDGWLILVAMGLALAAFLRAESGFETFVPIFRGGIWDTLTTPGSAHYHPWWAGILIFELLGLVLFIGAALGLLWLMSQKSRRFPRLFIAYLLGNLLFFIAEARLGAIVVPNDPAFGGETARELSRSVVGAAIWIPYMLLSRRVRNTFLA